MGVDEAEADEVAGVRGGAGAGAGAGTAIGDWVQGAGTADAGEGIAGGGAWGGPDAGGCRGCGAGGMNAKAGAELAVVPVDDARGEKSGRSDPARVLNEDGRARDDEDCDAHVMDWSCLMAFSRKESGIGAAEGSVAECRT